MDDEDFLRLDLLGDFVFADAVVASTEEEELLFASPPRGCGVCVLERWGIFVTATERLRVFRVRELEAAAHAQRSARFDTMRAPSGGSGGATRPRVNVAATASAPLAGRAVCIAGCLRAPLARNPSVCCLCVSMYTFARAPRLARARDSRTRSPSREEAIQETCKGSRTDLSRCESNSTRLSRACAGRRLVVAVVGDSYTR